MSVFDQAFAFTVGVEGAFTNSPSDPGNWTGGAIGVGQCKGTKYGISAASYPTLDIQSLTLDNARVIYQRDYWARVHGDNLPPPIAGLAFDGAVSQGATTAVKMVQSAAGAAADGIIGPKTLAAVAAMPVPDLHAAIAYLRLLRYQGSADAYTFLHGWTMRLIKAVAATASFT